VIGNFNNLFMLRVRETATAELLTRQLPKVEVYTTTIVSATDSSDIRGATDFHVEHPGPHQHVQRADDRAVARRRPAQRPMLRAAAGRPAWKVRMPLPHRTLK
jgi:hypothetical protein